MGFLLVGAVLAPVAFAQTTVTFVEPDRYTDAGRYGNDRKQAMAELERHLVALGERHLATGQTLRIEVLDVDLAGRIRYEGQDPQGVRVVTGRTDAPAIKLRYTLEAGGKVVETREERVSDMNYFEAPRPPGTTGSLYYEKRMLDDWFAARFRKPAR